MRKIIVKRPGGLKRLLLIDAPDPVPEADEVLIQVAASGVNFADCILRMGFYKSAKEYVGWPITPGFEISGTVVKCGSGIEDLRVGTPVIAVTRFGGYATQVTVRKDQVFPLPDGFDPVAAAGFPTVFLTAHYALAHATPVRERRRILVHSAAGGVGSALVQIGKVMGDYVVGVVGSSAKVDAAREMGADAVIDKSQGELWESVRRLVPAGYDVVLDANGYATLRESYRHVAPTGYLVTYGAHSMFSKGSARANPIRLLWGLLRTPRFDPLSMTTDNRGIVGFNLSYLFERSGLLAASFGQLLQWLASERLRLLPTTTFPLEEVREAHRTLQSGTTVGKIVLTTGNAAPAN